MQCGTVQDRSGEKSPVIGLASEPRGVSQTSAYQIKFPGGVGGGGKCGKVPAMHLHVGGHHALQSHKQPGMAGGSGLGAHT